MDITILHEYGARRHYEAVHYLRETRDIYGLKETQFSLMKEILLYRDCLRAARNLKSLTNLFTSSAKNVIVGVAPYDPIIPYLIHLKKRHRIIHHSSWLYWDGSKYPKPVIYPGQKSLWESYLAGLHVVTVTETARKNINQKGAIATCIPHSVNTALFRPAYDKSDKKIILYVGRLVQDKGVDYLLRLADLWHEKNIEFWFVGKGPLKEQIETMQGKYPVKYLGYISSQERLAEIYRNASVLALPASLVYEEVFGLVLIEAMASGLPVVAVDSAGPSEIIDDYENGLLVPRSNETKFADAIDYVLSNLTLARKMGMAGRKKALEKYAVTVVAKLWKDVMMESAFR